MVLVTPTGAATSGTKSVSRPFVTNTWYDFPARLRAGPTEPLLFLLAIAPVEHEQEHDYEHEEITR